MADDAIEHAEELFHFQQETGGEMKFVGDPVEQDQHDDEGNDQEGSSHGPPPNIAPVRADGPDRRISPTNAAAQEAAKM